MKRIPSLLLAACAMFALAATASAGTVKVARFWHDHQPIYWPDWSSSQPNRVQFAQDSIDAKAGGAPHPDNNLTDIFGHGDRVASYQGGPRNSLLGCHENAGYALSYSGSLIENVRSLANRGSLGYGDWQSANTEARKWIGADGGPRLDLVGFCYHHAFAPVLPKAVFRKELQIFKQAWWKAWGGAMDCSDHSKGFFPTEMAFTEEMIDVLRDEGYEWTIVAAHHFSRTCPTYLTHEGASAEGNFGIASSEPNRADMNGPSPTDGWWFDSPNPGNAAWNVAPFAYQLHKVQYVNPWTGDIKQMVAVPSDDVLSYKAGYSGATMSYADHIAYGATDPDHPVVVLPATDGDNAWGGGSSSWIDSWPAFTKEAAGKGWDNVTLQGLVNQYGDKADVRHIEDGAWIFPEMCYGSPYFLKWVDPPTNVKNLDACYPGTQVDLETPGFALKFWDWAPIIAGANWCETAEQIMEGDGTEVAEWKIATPYEWSDGSYNNLNVAEKAWHIYLCGLDSGFNYYGGKGNDDECKPPLANRNAINVLRDFMNANIAKDKTAPSMFRPQRFPWNPGGYTFGWFNNTPVDGAYRKKMGSDFYVWTHVYDVSGIPDGGVKLFVRADKDGYNPVDSIQNETFAGGDEVGEWMEIPMTKKTLPKTTADLNAAASDGDINYEYEPAEIADYYFAKVTQFRGQLVDYYVEAWDNKGNWTRSDIQHVWVDDDGTPAEGGDGKAASASFDPAKPSDCAPITVTFNAGTSEILGASTIYCLANFTGSTEEGWTNVVMTAVDSNVFTVVFTPGEGPFADNSPSLTVCFHGTVGTNEIWESRGGRNWTVSISDCDAPVDGVKISPNPAVAGQPVTVTYYPAGRALASASAVNIHHGWNGANWTTVPGDAMTASGANWTSTFDVPSAASSLVMCFNDGTTWDNNSDANWTFPVTGTVTPVVPFEGTADIAYASDAPNSALTIFYNPAGRPLSSASSVCAHYGITDTDGETVWTVAPGTAMVSREGGLWFDTTFTPAPGSVSLTVCFNNGSDVWDNNSDANWTFDLTPHYPAVADGLAITDPTGRKVVETNKATVSGTAGNDIVGPISWTNANARTGGTFPASSSWSQEVTLAGGTNEVVFSADVIGDGDYATDKASNYAKDENYTGLNKGTGFQPWITSIPTGSGGGNSAPDADLAFVVLSPGPTQGATSTVKFYANNEASALAHGTVQNVFVHWGATDAGGNASWTVAPGDPMTWVEADGAWEAQIAVPGDAVTLAFLFNDGGDTWLHYNDVKGGAQTDWLCEVAAASSDAQGGVFADAERGGFGMWEYFGYATKIFRPFGRNLTTNDVFSFTFKNGDVAPYAEGTQPGVGAGVCAVDGETIDEDCGFRFYFNGGQTVYETPYGNTTVGWTTKPMTVTLTMADTTNFTATFAIDGTVESTVTGAFEKPCNAFRAWSSSNKGDESEGQNYDVFVDNLVLGEVVYETVTAKAILVYGDAGEGAEIDTAAVVDTASVTVADGKLSLSADVSGVEGLSDGDTVEIWTTDDLAGEWSVAATVTVRNGSITLADLPFETDNLFLSIGKPNFLP
jgi:hypothetical protein